MSFSHTSSHRFGLSLVAIAAALAVCVNLNGRNNRWEQGANERLADYLYMDALHNLSLDSLSNGYEALRISYALDSTLSAKTYHLGFLQLSLASSNDDIDLFNSGYAKMRRYVDANPNDYYSVFNYASIADKIGDTNESVRVWAILDSLHPQNENVTFKYAEALHSTNDSANMAKSLQLYDRLEEAEGVNVGITAHKVRTYFLLGDTAAISTELKRLFDATPGDPQSHNYAASLYEALGKLDLALEQINIAASIDSIDGDILNHRANLMLSAGDTLGYSREVYYLVRNSDLPLESKIETVNTFAKEFMDDSTRQETTRTRFNALVEKYPENTDVLDSYLAYLLYTRDLTGAIDVLLQTIEADPDDPNRWTLAIQLYTTLNEDEKALDIALRGYERLPESSINIFLSSIYQKKGEYDKAIEMYQQMLDRNSDASNEVRANLLSAIGDIYHEKGDKKKTYEYYDRALEIYPGNTMTLNNYAYFLSLDGTDLDKAERMSATTLRSHPYEPTFLDTYAWVLYTRGEYEKAREYIDTALQYITPTQGHKEFYEHAAAIYTKLGETEKAEEFYQMALEAEQAHPDDESQPQF
ncbi:MAG: tetratricopeptide repeat protein [Muribaculaceae bacterium]|nr:tetratricopeptide repeat protein [Muribaculaceae bacterium]